MMAPNERENNKLPVGSSRALVVVPALLPSRGPNLRFLHSPILLDRHPRLMVDSWFLCRKASIDRALIYHCAWQSKSLDEELNKGCRSLDCLRENWRLDNNEVGIIALWYITYMFPLQNFKSKAIHAMKCQKISFCTQKNRAK